MNKIYWTPRYETVDVVLLFSRVLNFVKWFFEDLLSSIYTQVEFHFTFESVYRLIFKSVKIRNNICGFGWEKNSSKNIQKHC